MYFWKGNKMSENNTLKIKKYYLLILLACIFSSCQRDDICGEVIPTTPQLIIRFFDNENPLEFRSVNSLRVFAQGIEDPIATINRTTTDSIVLPLRSFEEQTTFILITDSADNEEGMETGNTDILTFNYDTREAFVSRPCGFIANYDNLLDLLEPDADNWIQSISIVNSTVENENEAHVQIFH